MSKSKISPKPVRKCCICGLPTVSPKSNHCFGCREIALHMFIRNIHGEAAEAIWDHVRRYGHVCGYTKTVLNMTDPTDPFYFVFDHMIPGDSSKIVLTFALLNEMKSDMTPGEFRYYILQFDKCFKTGAKIRRKELSRWYRLTQKFGGKPDPIMPPPASLSNKSNGKKCSNCGRPVYAPGAAYCWRCHMFAHNMSNRKIRGKEAKKIWKHVHSHGFVCEYTQTPLNLTDYTDPFYYEFDHTIPGNKHKVALTFSLLNEMKSEMTLGEFKYYVGQFAAFFRTGATIKKRKLSRWFKLAPKYT